MSKEKKKKKLSKKIITKPPFPFEKRNYTYFLIGLILLIIGYIFMMQGPANSFWSRTLAPVILVISYCVVFPIAILSKGGKKKEESVK
jgi:hypothetical protein